MALQAIQNGEYTNVKLNHLGINDSATIKLKFDEPKSGEGKFGTWYMYNAEIIEPPIGEASFFAAKTLHFDLSKYKAGDVVKLTAIEKKGKMGSYKGYKVERVSLSLSADDLAEVVKQLKQVQPKPSEQAIRDTLKMMGFTKEEDVQAILSQL